MDTETRLRRVEALEDIRCLKARYCDLCDDGYDADALTALFTDDAVWDGGRLGAFEGRAAIYEFFAGMPQVMPFAIHHITNSAIEVADNCTTASGRWYLLQTATVTATNEAVWLAGRYQDSLVNSGDGWRFSRVQLAARFLTTHRQGWAEQPFADLRGPRT